MLSNLLHKALAASILVSSFVATVGNAEANSSYPGAISPLHGKFTVVAVSETGDDKEAAVLAVHVAIRQAEDAGKPVEKVISSVAFQGPRNNPKPWTRKGGLKQFTEMADLLKPLYIKWSAGQDFLPDNLEKYSAAKHFDSRKHRDFGGFVVQKGNTCFYDGVKRKVQPVDTCTASYNKSNMLASGKKHQKTQLASHKQKGTTKLVARNDNKANTPVSSARGLTVASR